MTCARRTTHNAVRRGTEGDENREVEVALLAHRSADVIALDPREILGQGFATARAPPGRRRKIDLRVVPDFILGVELDLCKLLGKDIVVGKKAERFAAGEDRSLAAVQRLYRSR